MSWYWWLLIYVVASYPLNVAGIIGANWLHLKLVGNVGIYNDDYVSMGIITLLSPVMLWAPLVSIGLTLCKRDALEIIGRKIGNITHGNIS